METSGLIFPSDNRYSEVLYFLYHEAELLDNRRFTEWLGLLTEDIIYRMPVPLTRGRSLEYSNQMDILSENLASLRVRVDKLGTDFAWADMPPSRTRHMISNLRVQTADKHDEIDAKSSVLVYRSRFSRPDADLFSAERHDRLRRVEGQWRLAHRTVHLDQAVVGARHITVFF